MQDLDIDDSTPTATKMIYDFIGEYLVRNETPSKGSANRCSAASMCPRRRWYQNQGRPGEAMTPRKEVNFLLGDLSERVMLYFIAQSLVGPGKLYSEVNLGKEIGEITFQGKPLKLYAQKTLRLTGQGLSVSGHADGLGKRNSDGEWELIECKSSANYGFDSFKKDGPGDYIYQAHALMMTEELAALNVRSVRFFYLKKETGHLWDRLLAFDEEIAKKVVSDFIAANGETMPEKPHSLKEEIFKKEKTGRLIAQFPCTYCPYLKDCQGDHEVEFSKDWSGNRKPVYVFKR